MRCHFYSTLILLFLPFHLAAGLAFLPLTYSDPAYLRPKEPFSSLPLSGLLTFCYPFLIHSHNDLLNMFITSP